jgi:cellulose synthase/poly-beta-1,6-N-acetylglucosamine synthase-like glycosyltransferase
MHFLPAFDFNIKTFLFTLLALAVLTQLLYAFVVHARLAFYKKGNDLKETNWSPLTVIIAARNESDNLYENLPLILDQDYPEFEVIVVNHQSTDDSSYLLNAYSRQYPNLKIIEVAKSNHLKPGKKLPITIGIKGAKYDFLVFTDADCKPISKNWLKHISQNLIEGKELVLGFSPYARKKGFVNKLIRFDTCWIGMNYLSMALARNPYMSVGRNLAYTKNLFESVNGFKSHYAIPSGDDDLFVQDAAKNNNYTISLNRESFTISEPHETFSGWIRQKTRHFSTSNHYKVFKRLLLGIYPLTLLIMYFSFIILLCDSEFRWLSLSLFLFTILIKWWIQGKCLKKLDGEKFIPFLPFWDFFYALILPILFYTTDKKETVKW